ncbi:MAG: hypothetical protein FWE64_02530 [Alphaproteobacteria bacterium]|nr:hypothetical protein [Alphaproteobacteria bacterium]
MNAPAGFQYINDWLRPFDDDKNAVGKLNFAGDDSQDHENIFLSVKGGGRHETNVTENNILEIGMYFAIRHVAEPARLDDGARFLYPTVLVRESNPVLGVSDEYLRHTVARPDLIYTMREFAYEHDHSFKYDCFIYMLFHSQNRISSHDGANHWIPFSEWLAGSKDAYDSNFMIRFMNARGMPAILSCAAADVYDAGLNLWKYYFSKSLENHNASLYDVKEFFNDNAPGDAEFGRLESELSAAMKSLAAQIEPKIYEYGFSKG